MSELSHAERKKVGAILVSPNGGIIAEGVNGTPVGFDNACEDNSIETHFVRASSRSGPYYCETCRKHVSNVNDDHGHSDPYHVIGEMTTKPEVLHAESNAIAKIARSTNSSQGSTLYVTLSPCFDCAKLIIQAGIVRVVYVEEYRKTDSLDLLKKAGIKVEQCFV